MLLRRALASLATHDPAGAARERRKLPAPGLQLHQVTGLRDLARHRPQQAHHRSVTARQQQALLRLRTRSCALPHQGQEGRGWLWQVSACTHAAAALLQGAGLLAHLRANLHCRACTALPRSMCLFRADAAHLRLLAHVFGAVHLLVHCVHVQSRMHQSMCLRGVHGAPGTQLGACRSFSKRVLPGLRAGTYMQTSASKIARSTCHRCVSGLPGCYVLLSACCVLPACCELPGCF